MPVNETVGDFDLRGEDDGLFKIIHRDSDTVVAEFNDAGLQAIQELDGVDVSDDGAEVLSDISGVDFNSNLSVTDNGDGTVTIDAADTGPESDTHADAADDGAIVLEDVSTFDFGDNVSVTDNGDGSVTIDATDTNTDTDTHTDVSNDGATVLQDVTDINFGNNVSATDDGDGTVTVTASGGGGGGLEVYDVTSDSYGAEGDGSTDDTSAIQSAIDDAEAAGGGTVYFPPGSYLISSQITVEQSNITLDGIRGESVIDCSGIAPNTYPISVQGTENGQYDIDAASPGDNTLTLSSSGDESNFSVGQVIKIGSDDGFEGGSTPDGEMNIVSGIGSGTIELANVVRGDYQTSPRVYDTDTISNFTWDGLSMEYPDQSDSWQGPRLYLTHKAVVKNSDFLDCFERALTVSDSLDTKFVDIDVEGSKQDGSGYGINVATATTDTIIRDSTFTDTRHSVACSGSANPGVQRGLLVEGCTCSQRDSGYNYALDTHTETEDVTFRDNTLHECGIQVRGQDVRAVDNDIFYPSASGFRVWQPDNNIIRSFTARGNKVVEPVDRAIFQPGDHALISGNITDNEFIGSGSGVAVLISTCAERTNIDGNIIDNWATGIRFRDFGSIPGSASRFAVSANENNISNCSDYIYWGGSSVYTNSACMNNVFDNDPENNDAPIYEWGLGDHSKIAHNIGFTNHDQ